MYLNLVLFFCTNVYSHLLIFLFVLSDAVQQAAGDEGHGHEEDDGQAHDGCQNGHTEPEVLVMRESCRPREAADWFMDVITS